MRRSRSPFGILIGCTMAALAGCASTGAEDPSAMPLSTPEMMSGENASILLPEANNYPPIGRATQRPYDLVADDFAHALSQVESLQGSGTIIRVAQPRTPFAEALENALVNKLFDLDRTEQRTGDGVLMTSFLPLRTDDPAMDGTEQVTFIVAIDRIAMKRTYRIGDRYVEPTSSLFVRGVEPDRIDLDDRPFLTSSASAE